jgi:indolepyruvate ferredoxin oxidoreductase beta subunit
MLDVETLAKNAGAPAQASNMVLLGAAVPMLGIEYDAIKEAVRKIFSRKGEEIVNSNLAALDAGYQYSIESTK